MSAAHTPGPLHVKQMAAYLDQFELRGPVDSGVIVARTVPWGNAADVEDASEANARRLAAAWNACDGVPVEVLEAQEAGGMPWRVGDQIDQRMRLRDLIDALQPFVVHNSSEEYMTIKVRTADVTRARALIARTRT
jgi:hypothetical protein